MMGGGAKSRYQIKPEHLSVAGLNEGANDRYQS